MAIKFLNSVNADSGVLYVDAANDRVGIGTTSPANTLHVLGDVRIENGSGDGYIRDSQGNQRVYWGTGTYLQSRAGGQVAFRIDTSEKMRITSGGNVGINTTAPIGRIDIRANYGRWRVNGYGGMYFRNDSDTGYTRYIHPRSDGSLSFGRIADANLSGSDPNKFAASSYDQFYLDSSGTAFFNGGINFAGVNGANFVVDTDGQRIVWEHQRNGTRKMTFYHETDADTFNFNFESGNKLQINGNRIVTVNELGTAAASAATDFVAVTGDEMTGALNISSSTTWGTATTEALTIKNTGSGGDINAEHSLGRIRWQTNGTNAAAIDAIRDTPGNGHNVDIAFFTNTGGSSTTIAERMRINYNGNVGIGTTSPTRTFQVGGTEGQISSKVGSLEGMMKVMSSKVYIGSQSSHNLALMTGAAERVTIDTSGNVGIGTTSPSATLTVIGNQLFDGTGINLKRTGVLSGRTWNFGVDSNGLSVYDINSSSYRLTIDETGNVGIGTSSPDAKLNVTDGGTQVTISNTYLAHLQSASNCGLAITAGASSQNYIAFGDTDDYDEGIINYDNSTSSFGFRTAGTGYDLTINSSGNVGIGTTSPTKQLHVNGSYKLGTNAYIQYDASYPYTINIQNTASAGDIKLQSANGENKILLQPSTGGIDFHTNNLERMRITDGGNVGIGTTSPSSKLHVYNGEAIIATSTDGLKLSYSVGNSSGIIDTAFSDNNLEFRTNGTAKMWIANGGNVGIGTTTISGQEGAANGTPKLQVLKTGTTGSYDLVARFGTDQDENNSGASVLINAGNDRGLLVSAGRADSNRAIAHLNLIQYDGNELTDGLTIYQPNAGSSGATSGTNVGIGTTSPNAKIDVNISAVGEYAYFGSGSTRQLRLSSYNTTSDHAGHKINASSLNGEIILATGGTDAITVKNDQSLQFNSYGAGYLKSDADGNITVDADTIEDTLDTVTTRGNTTTNDITVNNVVASANVKSSNNYLIIDSTDNDRAVMLLDETNNLVLQTGTSSGSRGILFRAEGAERMRIAHTGNVGIGTTSPSVQLDIEDSGNVLIDLNTTTANANTTIRFQESGSNTATIGYDGTADGLVLANGGFTAGNGIFINGSNNVGIGTSSPLYPFSLDVDTTGLISRIYNTNANGQGLLIRAGSTSSATRAFQVASENDTKIMTVNSNGNVGIGTVNPSQALQVEGNADINGVLYMDYGSIIDDGRFRFGSDNDFSIGYHSSTDTLRIADGNTLASNVRLTVDSSGNIGVGTASPSEKLHVSGDVRIEGDLTVNGSYTQIDTDVNTTEQWNVTNDGTGPAVTINQKGAQDIMDVQDDGTSVFYIEDGGNVGIGTTNPTQKLHVVGTSNLAGAVQVSGGTFVDANRRNIYLDSFDAGGGAGIFFRDGFTYNASITAEDHNGSSADGICISGYDGISFSTGSNSKNEVVRITGGASGIGRVGIGTANPAYKLHIEGDSVYVTGGTSNGKWMRMYANDSWAYLTTNVGKYYLNAELRVDGGQIGSYNEDLQLRTSGNTKVTIKDSSGNVGIGTTSPAHDLHVDGDRLVFTQTGQTYTDGSSGLTGIGIRNTGTSSGYNAFGVQTGQGSVFQIRNNGAAIIGRGGTDSLDGYLVVNGGSGPSGEAYISLQRNSSQQFLLNTTAAETQVRNTGNLPLYFYTNDSIRMAVAANGNVGIGTTSPSAKLDVRGYVTFQQPSGSQVTQFLDSTGDGLKITAWDNGANIDPAVANDNLYFGRDVTMSNFIVQSGNVGIGTTSPSQKLQVAGIAEVAGALRVTESGTAQHILIGNQDSSGTDKPAMIRGVNGQLHLGHGNSWSGEGGTMTYGISITNGGVQFPQYGAGYLKTDASGNITVDTSTIEDTLDSVTDRGNTTTNSISVGEVTLSNAPASNNGTFVKVYSDNHKRMYTATLNFSFTAAGTYNFNLVFPNSGGYQYELTAVNSRNGLYRNFGTLKDSSYIYWEADEDFTHRAEGDLHMISSYTGGMYFSADTTYFLSDGVTDTEQTGTANWSYAIVRYSIYIPRYDGDVTGSWKLHLTTYGDTGSGTPQFVLA